MLLFLLGGLEGHRGEVMEEKKRRVQLTKEQKRVLAAKSTEVAFAEEDRRRSEAAAKTARLRALRQSRIQNPEA
jgi:hypothetical protein